MKVEDAARNSLMAYCSLITEGRYKRPAHIQRISRILEDVEAGKKKRVIITIPPRHGKSMLCSQLFPGWYIGRNPEKYLITATYGQTLSDDFGRKVRDQLSDPIFKEVFKARLRGDSRAVDRFETTDGGTYVGVGAGGAVTGRGGHLLLIDDPVKNREEADSETMREKIWEWYKSVAYTRLQPGGAIVIIMTRWHEDDLIGKVLREHTHENWEVINLKAIDGNEALWPEAYDIDALRNIEKTLGMYDFSCLYQQEPLPREGNLIKDEWLGKHKSFPASEYLATFIAVDPAISQKESNDETAIAVLGIRNGEPSPIDDLQIRHGHWDFPEQVRQILDAYNFIQPRPMVVAIEDVAYQRALGEVLDRKGLPIHLVKADVDKYRRAQSILHLFKERRVNINDVDARKQLISFRGKDERNDITDAIVHGLRAIWRCSSEGNLPVMDRYAHLDARSRAFWMAEKGDAPWQQKDNKDTFEGMF